MTSSGHRVPIVDALRGLLILWVVLFHFWVDTRSIPGAEVAAPAVADAMQHGRVRKQPHGDSVLEGAKAGG